MMGWRGLGRLLLLALALASSVGGEAGHNCEEVGKLFQGRTAGPVKGLPESPRAGKGGTLRGRGWE